EMLRNRENPATILFVVFQWVYGVSDLPLSAAF
ncbi:MAG: hypothetical protein QOH31_5673, partial [Verrucomicrobiota bacterium]